MKTHALLLCAICLMVSSPAYAKRDKDDSDYTDKIARELQTGIDRANGRIDGLKSKQAEVDREQSQNIVSLERRASGSEKRIADIEKKIQSQRLAGRERADAKTSAEVKDEVPEDASEIEDRVKSVEREIRTWKRLSFGLIAAVTVLFLSNVVRPRKAIVSSPIESRASSRPKCPRCGQEYDSGDTVCKNPNCKTQF